MTTRSETLTLRVSKDQKKRIQKLAKKKGLTISTLLLRAIESAESLPPSEKPPREEEKIYIEIGKSGEQISSRPEAKGKSDIFVLSEEAKRLGG